MTRNPWAPLPRRFGAAPGGAADASGFAAALQAAADALDSLSTKADALALVAVDEADANIAEQAQRFATVAGPAGLQRAKETGDAHYLANVQHGLQGVTADVTDALTTDAVLRFLAFPIAPLLALAPASVLEDAKEAIANVDVPLPKGPGSLPAPVFIGGGAALGFVAGGPRGAIVGGILGVVVKRALMRLAERFTL